MSTSLTDKPRTESEAASGSTMMAAVSYGVNDLRLDEVPFPTPGPGEAVVRVTMTTICGTDVHSLKGEWPVAPGRILGQEPVGVIHKLGPGVEGYSVGDRVLVGAITPCGTCYYCPHGQGAQFAGVHDHWMPGVAGGSATRSTASKPTTTGCRMRRQIWLESPTTCAIRVWCF